MFKIIGGILIAIMPVNSACHPPKPPIHYKCITKGQHHPEICVPVKWPHHK